MQQKKSFLRGPLIWLVILVLVVLMSQMLTLPLETENKEISYSEFLELVKNERISQLVVSEYDAYGLFARAIQHELDHLDGLTYRRLVKDPPPEFEKKLREAEAGA